MNVNTKNLANGEEVEKFLELAERGGYEVLRLVSDVPRSVLKISGFEILKSPKVSGARSSYAGHAPIVVKGHTHFYYDGASGFCMGFVIDTPHNREKIMTNLRNDLFSPLSEKVKAELVEEAVKVGIPTTPMRQASRFVGGSKNIQKLAKTLEKKDFQMSEMDLKKRSLENEIERLQARLEAAEANGARTLTKEATVEVPVETEDGDIEVQEVKAVVTPAKKTRAKPMKRKTPKK
jgi:hypothetical protein